MSTETQLPAGKSGAAKKRPALRPWFLAIILGIGTFYGWLFWPSTPETNPHQKAGLVKADWR